MIFMCRQYLRELVLAVVLVLGISIALDVFGDVLVAGQGKIEITAGLMAFGLVAIVLPALAGAVPSGFLLARKQAGLKQALLVPAFGAAIAMILLMAFSAVSLLSMTDAAWQLQIAQMDEMGLGFFSSMPLQEFKAMILASVAFGALFMAIFNFGLGLAGGYAGRAVALRKNKRN